jgi:hypothetical protein
MKSMIKVAEIENSTNLIQNASELVDYTDYHLTINGIKFPDSTFENKNKLREILYDHVNKYFEEFVDMNYPVSSPNLMDSILEGRNFVESHRDEILNTSVIELEKIIKSCPENYRN